MGLSLICAQSNFCSLTFLNFCSRGSSGIQEGQAVGLQPMDANAAAVGPAMGPAATAGPQDTPVGTAAMGSSRDSWGPAAMGPAAPVSPVPSISSAAARRSSHWSGTPTGHPGRSRRRWPVPTVPSGSGYGTRYAVSGRPGWNRLAASDPGRPSAAWSGTGSSVSWGRSRRRPSRNCRSPH